MHAMVMMMVDNSTAVCHSLYWSMHSQASFLPTFFKGSTINYNRYSSAQCTGTPLSTSAGSNGVCSSIGGKYRSKATAATAQKFSATSATSALKACFAGSETVTLESGGVKPISEVRAGDRVLAADASRRTMFSEVVYVPHASNADKTVFTHITTTQGRDIKMTHSHILPAGACGSTSLLPDVYASSVTVGDCIMTVSGMEEVSAVETVQGEGLYTIVTKEEYVVVNGIIASPFAYNHIMANLYYNIHRFVYGCVPGLLTSPLVRSANEVRQPPSIMQSLTVPLISAVITYWTCDNEDSLFPPEHLDNSLHYILNLYSRPLDS
jgi:Hint module